jgi:meso-butanediol dehydrogenase / (S,S)-butanediol dehydrogenase / diacetyl reductase
MGQLEAKAAVITGGGRGIGRAIVRALVREGADVLAIDRDEQTLRETAADAAGPGKLIVHPGDVTDEAHLDAAFARAEEELGPVTTLVNNAAVQMPGTVVDTPLGELDRMLDVNFRGVFLGCRRALPGMIENGGGSIVNFGSINALVAERNLAVYTATKGAVLMLSKAIAVDFAGQGVRCNAICPGFVDTPLNVPHYESLGGREVLEAGLPDFQPIGRAILADEIADSVVFLASDASTAITGTAFVVDGGATAGT